MALSWTAIFEDDQMYTPALPRVETFWTVAFDAKSKKMPQWLGKFASIARFRITRWARVCRMVMPLDDIASMSQRSMTYGSAAPLVPVVTPFGAVKLSSPSMTMGA